MEKSERFELYRAAEEAWGELAQYDQAIEEMGELIVAINKYKRKKLYGEYKNNPKIEENLIEELADVRLCLEQISGYVGEDNVLEMLDVKLDKMKREIDEMNARKEGK